MNTASLQRPWQQDAETIGLIGLAHGTSHFFHLLLPPLFPSFVSQFGLSSGGIVLGGFLAVRFNRNEATIAIALGLSALLSVWLAFGTVPTGALLTLLGAVGFGVGVAGPNRDLLVRRAATARFSHPRMGASMDSSTRGWMRAWR